MNQPEEVEAVEIGEEDRPEHLDEGVLGRALDDLLEYGVTELVC